MLIILRIQALRSRYAKLKVLKQLYVCELLKLVIQNSKRGDKTLDLAKHYDTLESHLGALETLGVGIELASEFLYPMVESSLPDDLLIAWQQPRLQY